MEKEVNNENFHEETFEPVTDTPVEESPEDTPEPDSKTEVPTEESVEDTPKVDNDTVRYEYQQSRADKAEYEARQIRQELDTLRQEMQTQAQPKDEIPQKPVGDDPIELMNYNTQMNEYIAKQVNELKTERQKEAEQKQAYERQMTARNQVIDKLTDVTKNPQKAQKILNFFGDTQNLQDPVMYNVMYDAAMAYKSKSSTKVEPPNAPPPPVDGGVALDTKKTPDDEFNEQLTETNKYRL